MKKFFGIILFLIIPLFLSAQTHSSKGTRFRMSFMAENNILQGTYNLILSTEKSCHIKIKSSDTTWKKELYLGENCTDTIQVPPSVAVAERYNRIINKSLEITSSDSISLYAQYHLTASFDIGCILPESELGSEYIIQAYPNKAGDAQFLVIATQDSTIIDIYPSCIVSGNFSKIKPIKLRLDLGKYIRFIIRGMICQAHTYEHMTIKK